MEFNVKGTTRMGRQSSTDKTEKHTWLRIALGGAAVTAAAIAVLLAYRSSKSAKLKKKRKYRSKKSANKHNVGDLNSIIFDSECRLKIRSLFECNSKAIVAKLNLEHILNGQHPSESASANTSKENLEMKYEQFVWVDSREELRKLKDVLELEKEFSFDVEHHSYYSYKGVVCLFQIGIDSTKVCYLVDALKLRRHIHILRDVLQSDSILKIMHGADNDVLWLQRDFQIFLVNVFDTQKACKVLGFQRSSLAHLLEMYFGIIKDTSHQKADWRKRPLPKDMLDYACVDVQYLFRLKEILGRELLKSSTKVQFNKLVVAYHRSQKITLKTYKYNEIPARKQASIILSKAKQKGHVKKGQDEVKPKYETLLSLTKWRLVCAKKIDVSLQGLLPDRLMVVLSCVAFSTESEVLDYIETFIQQYENPYWNKEVFLENIKPLIGSLLNALHHKDFIVEASGKSLKSKGDISLKRAQHITNFTRKSPAYENCKMFSREGDLLCFCDKKKVKWYISKGLAKQVNENEETMSIQLLFENRKTDQEKGDNESYPCLKKNACVGCGDETNYLRYRIVPSCYRKFFPTFLKSHRSHDIVLLCVDCHLVAHKSCESVKREIASDLKIPLNIHSMPSVEKRCEQGKDHFDWSEEVDIPRAYRAALALTFHGESMPQERVNHLKKIIIKGVSSSASIDQCSDEIIKNVIKTTNSKASRKALSLLEGRQTTARIQAEESKILKQPSKTESQAKESDEEELQLAIEKEKVVESGEFGKAERSVSAVATKLKSGQHLHGEMVVKTLLERGGEDALLDLIMKFRASFVSSVKPKHLPKSWSVQHTPMG